jgi:hypothetical protein
VPVWFFEPWNIKYSEEYLEQYRRKHSGEVFTVIKFMVYLRK